jgi:DNA-binding GntR family transcriptional regulator
LILHKIREGAPRLLQAHRMYVDALRRRDKEAARLWARRHLEDWRKGFQRAGGDLDQPIDRIYLQSR